MNSSEALKFNVEVEKFNETIDPPRSKSYANRALICAALLDDVITIAEVPKCTDVTYLLNCFKLIGLDILIKGESVTIQNSFPHCEKQNLENDEAITLDTGDGGTTNRFLLTLLSKGKKRYRLKHQLNNRPMEDLARALTEMGVFVEFQNDEIIIQGPPSNIPTSIEIDCGETTQFASALMMVYPTIDLTLKNLNTSKLYLKMTESVIEKFSKEKSFKIPVDWSSLSYPIALAVVKGKVLLKDVNSIDPNQADSKLIEILKDAGGIITFTSEGLEIKKSTLNPFEVDCSDFPDLVPSLSFIASTIEQESVLKNISVLRFKESNRLNELFTLFDYFSVKYRYSEKSDCLYIAFGGKKSKKISYKAPADHRMIMTAYLFMRFHSGGLLHNIQHVNKSYPNFFDDLSSE